MWLTAPACDARGDKTKAPRVKSNIHFFIGCNGIDKNQRKKVTKFLSHSTTPPLHHSTTPLLHHSTTPPLHHSTTPPLHHSTTPPLHYSPSASSIPASPAAGAPPRCLIISSSEATSVHGRRLRWYLRQTMSRASTRSSSSG